MISIWERILINPRQNHHRARSWMHNYMQLDTQPCAHGFMLHGHMNVDTWPVHAGHIESNLYLIHNKFNSDSELRPLFCSLAHGVLPDPKLWPVAHNLIQCCCRKLPNVNI